MLGRTIIRRALLQRTIKNAVESMKISKRNAGHGVWSYRVPPPLPSKQAINLANGLGAICWFWIFWHILTEPDHIYGEWPYIDPSTWTDEELGVPPDSAGSLRT